MGTKSNPAPNDCYAKAEDDEPCSRSSPRLQAPSLIRLGRPSQPGVLAFHRRDRLGVRRRRRAKHVRKVDEAGVRRRHGGLATRTEGGVMACLWLHRQRPGPGDLTRTGDPRTTPRDVPGVQGQPLPSPFARLSHRHPAAQRRQ